MKRKIFSLALLLMVVLGLRAQDMGQLPVVPMNPNVKTGVLPNGLTYYILHNEEPKGRANFYIAQKVGSTLEEQSQLGLAHFLEHMAFNGTKNYPGKTMLNYLQSKGIRFGADINAATGFDETVYNINNVPTSDKNLMDSVLLVLHDWSGSILLEEAEIDAERGVIEEEWRSRNSAGIRMYEKILPEIYQEYQYQQLPIGKMEVIRNFEPETLRAYYTKWYRPDQQGIIIVGDFDANEMEQKVKDLFSKIPMPKNAAPRKYPAVSDNKEPIYSTFTDPEQTQSMTIISFKLDKAPMEIQNTVPVYLVNELIYPLVLTMFNQRLHEQGLDPDCAYAFASASIRDFYVSKTKESFDITVIAKTNTRAAVAEAMAIVARACKTGFTDTEYFRAKEDYLAALEKEYNERNKTSNEALADQLCNAFTDNQAFPSLEEKFNYMQQKMADFPVEMINQVIAELLTSENMVVVSAEPQGKEILTKEAMISTITDAMNAKYEAYVDEVITDPLIQDLRAPGTKKSEEYNSEFDVTIFTLSNGIKVLLKTTDFADDEIVMTAFREGGKRIYSQDQAPEVLMIEDVYEAVKFGDFDVKKLGKYLSGKNVSLSFGINRYTDVLSGKSTVKDLPTLLELVYSTFMELNPDAQTFNTMVERYKPLMANAEKNPQTIFFNELAKTQYGNNALMENVTLETLNTINYDKAFEMLKAALSQPAAYTFIFSGNIDKATFIPLIETYLASLPSGGLRKPVKDVTSLEEVRGQVSNIFKQPMQVPMTMVYNVYSDTNLEKKPENAIMMSMIGDILSNIYIDTLREEEGGTYSPQAGAQYNPNTNEWNILYFFMTNAEQQEQLRARANKELMNLLQNGADEVNFNKVKEAKLKQHEINLRKNSYWNDELMGYLRGFDTLTNYETILNNLTLSDFNNFMRNLYNGQNRIELVMDGVPAE